MKKLVDKIPKLARIRWWWWWDELRVGNFLARIIAEWYELVAVRKSLRSWDERVWNQILSRWRRADFNLDKDGVNQGFGDLAWILLVLTGACLSRSLESVALYESTRSDKSVGGWVMSWELKTFLARIIAEGYEWWQCERVWDHEMNEYETRFSQDDDD